MKRVDIEQRVEEIQKLITSNQLNLATKRLMDFVEDFHTVKKRKREVINIRATWNQLREDERHSSGSRGEILSRTQTLRAQILDFLDSVYEEQGECETSREVVLHEKASLRLEPIHRFPDHHSDQKEPKTRLELEKIKFVQGRGLQEPLTDIVVDCKRVTKTFKSKAIEFNLGPISIEMRLGEITGVVGENGSGKSTLLAIVAGRLKNDSGTLDYPHLVLATEVNPYHIKQQIAYHPQEFQSWAGPISDTLHFSAVIRGIKGDNNEEEVDFIISRLELDKYREASWHELSGGFKMRLALAKALVWHPKLLVLDEPLANLDINTQTLFLRDLRDLTRSIANPMAILVSSQHLHRIESIADNIIFLKEGKAIYNGSIAQLGDKREENSFEVECDLSKEELMDLLEGISYRDIEIEGNVFFIHTSPSVTDRELLQVFVENDVTVRSFRDISKSTRRLFRRRDGL